MHQGVSLAKLMNINKVIKKMQPTIYRMEKFILLNYLKKYSI